MVKLSIIIPCYNCAGTLQEAVDSIYHQELEIEFDVTMVDDGSTDSTYAVMQGLYQKYPNITLVKHDHNRGGGAARNTAVEHSDGEIIFCLDSDDILGPNFLKTITRYWLNKLCDGVGISTSIKFNNKNVNDVVHIHTFVDPDQKVRFETLLDGSLCSLYSTFLITRIAFNKIGGYPTDHGFDTQGMAFRFLCNGFTAYTCPDTVYYHRVNYHQSYYVREAFAGRVNQNWFKVYDEFLYIFNDTVKALILSSKLFPNDENPQSVENIVLGKANIFSKDLDHLISLGSAGVANEYDSYQDKYFQYWIGGFYLAKNNYEMALEHFEKALKLGFDYPIIYCKVLETAIKCSGSAVSLEHKLSELQNYLLMPGPKPLSRKEKIRDYVLKNPTLAALSKPARLALRLIKKF